MYWRQIFTAFSWNSVMVGCWRLLAEESGPAKHLPLSPNFSIWLIVSEERITGAGLIWPHLSLALPPLSSTQSPPPTPPTISLHPFPVLFSSTLAAYHPDSRRNGGHWILALEGLDVGSDYHCHQYKFQPRKKGRKEEAISFVRQHQPVSIYPSPSEHQKC